MNDPAYDQIPLSAPSQVVPLSYAPPVLVAPRDIIPATAVPAAAHEMYPPPPPPGGGFGSSGIQYRHTGKWVHPTGACEKCMICCCCCLTAIATEGATEDVSGRGSGSGLSEEDQRNFPGHWDCCWCENPTSVTCCGAPSHAGGATPKEAWESFLERRTYKERGIFTPGLYSSIEGGWPGNRGAWRCVCRFAS